MMDNHYIKWPMEEIFNKCEFKDKPVTTIFGEYYIPIWKKDENGETDFSKEYVLKVNEKMYEQILKLRYRHNEL